jgi:hypothetical protein
MEGKLVRQLFVFTSDAFKYRYVIDIAQKNDKLLVNYYVNDATDNKYLFKSKKDEFCEPFVSMKDVSKTLKRSNGYAYNHCTNDNKKHFAKAIDKCLNYLSNHGELIGEDE